MNRITPEMVKEAAEKTGLTLIRDTLDFLCVVDEQKGCPIDALLVATNYAGQSTRLQVASHLGVSCAYLSGFVTGIDGGDPEYDKKQFGTSCHADIDLGYSDGLACAAAVFGEAVA